MNQPIFDFFEQDHRRLEGLLEEAIEDMSNIKMDLYEQFRVGILTHIKMEEKILFPAAVKGNGGEPLPIMPQLRLDHGAITSLVVPPPDEEVIKVLTYLLELHDEVEEAPGGVYEACEALTKNDTESILEELRATTDVPLHPHNTKPIAKEAAIRAVARAGYDFWEIVEKV